MAIELKEKDAGIRTRMKVGERATIRLEENPTTGFRWAADFDDAVIALVDDRYEGPEEPRGAGGVRVLVFEAVRSGSAALSCAKKRAWGAPEPVATFAVELEVHE